MKTNIIITNISLFIISIFFIQVRCQLYDWRGPDRSGVYNEFNLLKEWPDNGPKLIWEVEGIGNGFSSVTISDDAIYVTGKKDHFDVLTAFTLQGKKKWETVYGKSWEGSYPESRCTPTYIDGKIFVVSGQGDLVCINTDGEIEWSKNYFVLYEANAPPYGISESPLVTDDLVIVTPGGSKASMVAFNIETGNIVWQAKPLNDLTQYVNPKMINYSGTKIVITLSENYIIAVDSKNGTILWTFNYAAYFAREGTGYTNHAITPIYWDGYLFVTSGYNYTAIKLNLNRNCDLAEVVWENPDMDPPHGGVVLVNNYLYGSTYESNSIGKWSCLDWETGNTMWKADWHGAGSIISANGMLYLYEEKTGYVGLVKPDPDKFDVVSEFKITRGTGPHWAHPVIRNGKLYLRHGDVLMVFSI
jgi:outer membrane protein assembly factor BamB